MKKAAWLLLALLAAARLDAHEVRPGYLEIRQTGPAASHLSPSGAASHLSPSGAASHLSPSGGTYEVLWKVPAKGDLRLRLDPRFPDGCEAVTPVSSYAAGGAFLERWTLRCPQSLVGGTITIDGLQQTLTDVLVRFEPLEGPAQTMRVLPAEPSFVISATPAWTEVARTYLLLGVEHILGGIDHLLFVLALLLIVEGWRQLVATVTSFTLAHSITLALATLGFVHVPSAPVEAVIALSILFLASEIVHSRQGRPGLTERSPWVVAFTFGLLHGFGFAGALSEVGLPESAIPLALFLFNVGVEVGQLLFVAAILVVLAGNRRFELRWPVWAWRLPTYAIGTMAAFWTVQRVVAFW